MRTAGNCPICSSLDEEKRNMDEMFSNGKLLPPGHPSCRCAVAYEEIPGTNLNPSGGTLDYEITGQYTGERRQDEVVPDSALPPIGGGDKSGLTNAETDAILSDMKVQDVMGEYLKTSTPGQGAVIQDAGYKQGKHQEEIKIANWLHDTYGGDIKLLNEADGLGVKTPDFNWREKLWELKTVTTMKSADDALRRGLKQIRDNPGGIILDYGGNEINLEALQSVINKRIARGGLRDFDVMIVSNEDTLRIFRYKK